VLANLLEALYNKVLINIVVKRSTTEVYIELCSKKGVISHASEQFETNGVNDKMLAYIEEAIKESPYYYIAILDFSKEQGAIPTCNKHKLDYYYDTSASEYKCFNDTWTFYTSKTDLYEVEKSYKDFGVDFVFSPFSILYNFFQEKIESHIAMFILVQESVLSLCVFDNGKLLYGEHLDLETQETIDDELLSNSMDDSSIELDDGIDLEEIDALEDIDSLEGLDDFEEFGDIEDLETLEDIDEFSENQDIEEEFYEAEEPLAEASDESFNEDYQRFSLIQSSLGHFYHSDKYESTFVESVYIADGVGVSSDLKRYLEEEMFLNVYVRHADLGVELAEITKMELGL